MKRALLSSIACLSLGSSALAIDFGVGIGYTSLSPSGYVKYKGDTIDVKDDLNLGRSKKAYAYVDIGLPILPDIKVEYFPVEYSGSNTLKRNITFRNKIYTVNSDVSSKVKLDQLDIASYYKFHTPFIKPRVGLAVKVVFADIKLNSSTLGIYESKSLTAPIPLAYAGVYAEIPKTPFAFDVEAKGMAYSGNYFIDFKGLAMLKYKVLYAGVGYRYQKIKIDNISDTYSDLKFKGLTIETGLKF